MDIALRAAGAGSAGKLLADNRCRAKRPKIQSNIALSRQNGLLINGSVLYPLLVPNTGALYTGGMRMIALKTLRLCWERHPDVRQALPAWYRDAKQARWTTPADIRNLYRHASFVGHHRVVFNIRGHQYRLVVAINDAHGIVYLRCIGSHQDDDQIDATTI